MARVVVGLSGGVDSSVAAYLLKEQGYDVHALFMKNWEDHEGTLTSSCTWEDDWSFAQLVAKKLDIPLHFVDFSKEYRERVVNYMFSEYQKGRTPNPDVLCNREVKFDLFVREAEKYQADYVATGHYCRKKTTEKDGKPVYSLFAGKDNNKDQSYFLCQISQEQLAKSLFPIGDIDKTEVRRIADSLQLATAHRKDSQGICFVGKVDLPQFLQQKLKPKQGDIIKIAPDQIQHTTDGAINELAQPYDFRSMEGKKVGVHQGAHYFTVGQRRGLNVGGTQKPLYVIGTDVDHNVIYVGEGSDHPGLYRKALFISAPEMHWLREDLAMHPGEQQDFDFRIRYRQPLQSGSLVVREEGAYIRFEERQRGITPGQFAAWYKNDELIGSGVIKT